MAEPQGGFYLFPDFERWRQPLARRGVESSEQLSALLLEEYRLSTLPGTAFGMPPASLTLRLSTSYLDLESDDRAAAMLEAWQRTEDAGERQARWAQVEGEHRQMAAAIDRFARLVDDLNR